MKGSSGWGRMDRGVLTVRSRRNDSFCSGQLSTSSLRVLISSSFFEKLEVFFFKEKRESKFQQAPKTSQNSLETRLPTCFFLFALKNSCPFSHFCGISAFFLWHGCQTPRNSPRSFGHLPHGWRTALGE